MSKVTFEPNTQTGELTITGVINAPIEKVWEAWTNPELFKQWWGPRGWETTVKDFSLQPGGGITYGMKCVDESQGEWFGQESWGKMVYNTIEAPHTLNYTDYFCDADGTINNDMPATTTTMRFETVDGGTKMMNVSKYESAEALQKVLDMGMQQGFTETWERLDEMLTK